MNIFKLLFEKNNIELNNMELIRLGDNLILPERNDLNSLDDIQKLDYYKKHYTIELLKNECITTLIFNSKKLKEEMNMNTHLILKVLMNNDYFYKFSSNDLIIETIKLNIYLNRINILQKEVILRLIALKEIEIDSMVPRHNKITLLEEINKLSVILQMFYNQIGAIKLEIDSYLDMIKERDINEDISNLKQRFDTILYLSNGIIDNFYIDDANDIKYNIASLETLFEKYVYLNKDKLEEAKVELSNLEKDIKDKKELLSRCIYIEKVFMLFKNFSNNLDIEEYIYKLSEVKFKLLTENIQDIFNNSISKNDLLFDYYLNILSVKIENILSGNNTYFNDTFFLNEKDAVYVFRDCLKENGLYNLENILVDKFKLSLVLSFDEENGYERMLKNITLDCSNIAIGNFPGIVWNSKVPIHSILSMIERKENIIEPYYNLFLMYYQAYLDLHDEYYLPEGILEFNSYSFSNSFYFELKNEMFGKTVYLPSTLEVLSGPIFSTNGIKRVYFNGSLKVIDSNVKLNSVTMRHLKIPSTLQSLDFLRYNILQVNIIEFMNAEESYILHNRDELYKLFTYIYYNLLNVKIERIILDFNYGNVNVNLDELINEKVGYLYKKEELHNHYKIPNIIFHNFRQVLKEKNVLDLLENNKKFYN